MKRFLTLLKRKDIRSYISRSWSVSWPMTLMMFFEFLIGLTDAYIAGRVNKEIQATYGFVIQLYFIFIVIANALTVGTVSVVSKLFTSGNKDELTEAVFSSIVTTTIAGIVLAASGILFSPEIIKILNIPLWLVRIPLSYIFVVLFGFGAVSVWWSMNLSQFVQAFLISKRYFNRGWLRGLT